MILLKGRKKTPKQQNKNRVVTDTVSRKAERKSKMTRREFFVKVVEMGMDAELVEFAKNEIAKLDNEKIRRASKPSKVQIANAPIIEKIADFLKGQNEPMVASDIANALELTPQKVSALVKKIDGIQVSEVVRNKRVVKAYAL